MVAGRSGPGEACYSAMRQGGEVASGIATPSNRRTDDGGS